MTRSTPPRQHLSPGRKNRHPEFWPDPERFDPERFAPDRAGKRDFFACPPFAAGLRTCIGAGMAMLGIQLILALLAPRFRMRVVPGHPIEPEARVTLKPRSGIPVTLSRRSRSPTVSIHPAGKIPFLIRQAASTRTPRTSGPDPEQ